MLLTREREAPSWWHGGQRHVHGHQSRSPGRLASAAHSGEHLWAFIARAGGVYRFLLGGVPRLDAFQALGTAGLAPLVGACGP